MTETVTARTTASGTPFTTVVRDGAGGKQRYHLSDAARASGGVVPAMLFSHGAGGTYESMDQSPTVRAIRDHAVDLGMIVYEADSGGSANNGNDAAQQSMVEGVAWLDETVTVGPIVVFGVSMGNIIGYWNSSLAPHANRVAYTIVQEGVTDLTHWYTVTPLQTKIVGNAYGLGWTETVQMEAWVAATEGHDPMRTDPAVWRGRRVFQIWDTADATVPWEDHGKKWVERFGGSADVEVMGTEGMGHTVHASHRDAIITRLDELFAPPPLPPRPLRDEPVWRVSGMTIVGADRALYSLS